MRSLKTYYSVQSEKENSNFSAASMHVIHAKKKGKTDEPHRHDYYTVLVIKNAHGKHKIDFNTYELGPKQVFFVAPGQVHQLIEEQASDGYVLTFSNEFLIENGIPFQFIEELNLFRNYGHSPPLLPDAVTFSELHHFASEIYRLFVGQQPLKNHAIGAYLKLLLIRCNTICSLHPIKEEAKKNNENLLRNFKTEVDNHFTAQHSTRFYAEKLNVSADHLNRTIKSTLGKTAKSYIQDRITTEAKRLLFFSDLSSKEIGYSLGFNEPANFSAFFKKCTSISPKEFKKTELFGER